MAVMRSILTLCGLAACALAKGVPAPAPVVADVVGLTVTESPSLHQVEVAVTDDTLDSDGLLVAASMDVKVDVVAGHVVINDQFTLPVGLTQITMKTDVKRYALSLSGSRQLPQTVHDIDVGLAARVEEDPDVPYLMHVTLQLTEYDGQTREVQHTTLVSVTLNADDEEQQRVVNPQSPSLSADEKAQAADHPITAFMDDAESDASKGSDWFMQHWNDADAGGKAAIVSMIVGLSLLVLGVVGVCCRACTGRKEASKGANYKKNLSMGPVRVVIPRPGASKYKYTQLPQKP